MADIDLAASAWLGIGIEAAEAGDRARAVAALTAISGKDWEAIRARLGDELFADLTSPLRVGGDDFDRHVDRALAISAPAPVHDPVTVPDIPV